MAKHPTTPCNECPFSRNVKPNALGGSPAHVYVGQAYGPFWLPCHKHTDFNDPNWKQDHTRPQCAGAAIFRANVGAAERMPAELLQLPPNDELVFSSYAGLLAHHNGVSIEVAACFLRLHPPEDLFKIEYVKASQVGTIRKATPQ